ncbi:MAG TPA: isochorismatase family protein [Chitinophagaceae bacterium]|nr:isochorismatase family protein [Chitinophagaceae bacterium]
MVLRSLGITHIVLAGIATSGVALSTLREAADKDYQITVVARTGMRRYAGCLQQKSFCDKPRWWKRPHGRLPGTEQWGIILPVLLFSPA